MGELDHNILCVLVFSESLVRRLANQIVTCPARDFRFDHKRRFDPMHIARGLRLTGVLERPLWRGSPFQCGHKLREIARVETCADCAGVDEFPVLIGADDQRAESAAGCFPPSDNQFLTGTALRLAPNS